VCRHFAFIYHQTSVADMKALAEFAEFLAQMRDVGKIDVLTNEQAYLAGRIQE
jgi:hypothetical protein